jgi:hypothetical protein
MDMQAGYKINVYYNSTSNSVTTATRGPMIVADRYIQHPSYSRTTLNNDLTLIHLPTPIPFGKNVSI